MRLLMVAPPYAGHLHPLLVIAQHLRTHGVTTTFVTGPARVALCRALGFEAVAAVPDDPTAMERIANTPQRVTGHPVRSLRQVRDNLRLLPRALADVQRAADVARPDAIVADFCAPVAGAVARRAGVPWLTTVPTPFVLENRRGTPAYCGGWAPSAGPLGRVRDALGRGSTRAAKSVAGRLFRDELAVFGGSLYRPDGSEVFYSDRAILALGLRELEFERDWPTAVQFVGPITAVPHGLAPDASAIAEQLDESCNGHRRVLVTLGTHLPWAKRSLVGHVVRLSECCADHDFVVALGASSYDPALRRVSPRVRVADWLPYDDVLPAFDAVIHHGGAGITHSTLRAGLPCLVWPHDYDQFDYAARLVHHGLGLRIRRLPDAAAALRRLEALPRGPLHRFAGLLAGADPLGAVRRALTAQLG